MRWTLIVGTSSSRMSASTMFVSLTQRVFIHRAPVVVERPNVVRNLSDRLVGVLRSHQVTLATDSP